MLPNQLTIVRGAVGSAHEELLQVGEPGWDAYCKEWGFNYVTFHKPWQSDRYPAWNKILWLLHFLEDRGSCQGLIWADTDTLLTDPSQDLRLAIPATGVSMLWCNKPWPHYNSGVMALRNDLTSYSYLRIVWEKGQLPGGYEQPTLNHYAKSYQVSDLTTRWHTITTIGQRGGVITGYHGDPQRLEKMKDQSLSSPCHSGAF